MTKDRSIEWLVHDIRVTRDELVERLNEAQVRSGSWPVTPMPGDARAWAMTRTKLDEALMWAERALTGGV